MESLLLSVHVLAGILFVGPIAVATSLFPRYAPAGDRGQGSPPVAELLHRIARVYGLLALTVPAVGLLLAVMQGRTTEIWIVLAVVLTAVAGSLLALQIVPAQRQVLESADGGVLRQLTVATGIFNLLWATVVVLMIVRPGAVSA